MTAEGDMHYTGDPVHEIAMTRFLLALDTPNLEFNIELDDAGEVWINLPQVGGFFGGRRDKAISFIESIQEVNRKMEAEGAPRGPLDDNLDRICAAMKKAITQ